MRKLFLTISVLIYILGSIYLSLPNPQLPDLSDSYRSTEEGDTWQHPDQKGYYTQRIRSTVIQEMLQKFTLKLGNFTLPNLRLNYPPEYATSLVRDQLNSNYLEEIVHPLRESLFINGWEPENDPKLANIPMNKRSSLKAQGIVYYSKVTLKPVYSSFPARLLIWSLIFPGAFLCYKSLRTAIDV